MACLMPMSKGRPGRRLAPRALALSALLLTAASASSGAAVRLAAVHDPRTGAYIGQAAVSGVIVQFQPSASDADRAVLHAAIGATESRNLGRDGLFLVTLPPGIMADVALRHFAASSLVQDASPNYPHYLQRMPNDPLTFQQYALLQMNVSGAWEYATGVSSPVTVAIMDTGIEGTHPDLAAKYDSARSRAFCPATGGGQPCAGGTCNGNPGTDGHGHGTGVAGIAAGIGDNGTGIAGVHFVSSPTLVSLKIATDQGCLDSAAVVAAINYAATLSTTTGRRTVVNMSFGDCPTPADPASCGACSGAQTNAVRTALAAPVGYPGYLGAVLVAASGNLGAMTPFGNISCPAKITDVGGAPGVIAVGATDINQRITYYSCGGAEMSLQGVVAPGHDVWSTLKGGGYGSTMAGTSFASPQVTGLAALILSKQPSLTPLQVLNVVRGSADRIGPSTLGVQAGAPAGNSMGAGRVNAFAAMRLAVRGTLADFEGRWKAIPFPNPYRPTRHGNLTITVPDALAGYTQKTRIYTMDGVLVKEFSGLSWGGRTLDGTPAATGAYMFQVTTDAGTASGKFYLIR